LEFIERWPGKIYFVKTPEEAVRRSPRKGSARMTNKFDALFEERNKFDDLMGQAPVRSAAPKAWHGRRAHRAIHLRNGRRRASARYSHRITLRALQRPEMARSSLPSSQATHHRVLQVASAVRRRMRRDRGRRRPASPAFSNTPARRGPNCDAYPTRRSRKRSRSCGKHDLTARARRARAARPRKRRQALEAHFAAQNQHPRTIDRHGARVEVAALIVQAHRRIVRAALARLERPRSRPFSCAR
jgi:hypothetical protein